MLATTLEMWQQQDRHGGDRDRLFGAVAAAFPAATALYPGSWADVAVSFWVDDVTYVDSDRRAAQFFSDHDGVDQLIQEHRGGRGEATWWFHAADYREPLPIEEGSVDLLVSLYAGLVSDHCARYLRSAGHVLANASHGDASVLALDDAYRLVGVVTSRGGEYVVRGEGLDGYLIPKRPEQADADMIRAAGRGIAYTKPAFAYVFEKA